MRVNVIYMGEMMNETGRGSDRPGGERGDEQTVAAVATGAKSAVHGERVGRASPAGDSEHTAFAEVMMTWSNC